VKAQPVPSPQQTTQEAGPDYKHCLNCGKSYPITDDVCCWCGASSANNG
jgi:hypothetical protein